MVTRTEFDDNNDVIEDYISQVEQKADSVTTTVSDLVNDLSTSIKIDSANGLELSQKQDSEYYAQLTQNTLYFKLRNGGKVAASFGAEGGYVDRLRSNKTLSVGTEEDGWFDMTALPGGVGDKWRDGSNSSLPPIITQQPQDYYAMFVSGSHPLTGSTSWPESFTLSVQAENVSSYQWQYRMPNDDNSGNWFPASGTNTNATYTSSFDCNVISNQFRCKIVGADESVIFTNPVRVVIEGSPVVFVQPETYYEATAGQQITVQFVATDISSYQWQYRSGSSASGAWANVDSNNNPQQTTRTQSSQTALKHYYRCVLTGSNGAISTTDEFIQEWK